MIDALIVYGVYCSNTTRLNGTTFELVDVYLSNGFVSSSGTWYHCNFTAKEDKGDQILRVFFTEIQGLGTEIVNSKAREKLNVTACVMLLPGKTTIGCYKCSNVIHPTCGFHEGFKKPVCQYLPLYPSPTSANYSYTSASHQHLSLPASGLKPKLDTPDSEVQSVTSSPTRKIDALPPRKQERVVIPPRPKSEDIRRAKVALKLYNNKYNKEYEFVDVLKAEVKVADGIWYHCNFTAKLPSSDADAAPPMFFAEMEIGSDSLGNLSLGVTACYNLEEGETRIGCFGCCEVIHPLRGFVMGLERSYQ